MRVVSLFAGIGGFDISCERYGHSIIYANEYDNKVADVYEYHFGSVDRRDIRDIKSNEIPDHDLLVGGPPCQSFSLAGKQRGFEDERGNLVFDFLRVLTDKRPRYFLFENVKMFLGHDSRKTWKTFLTVLSDVGYECQWQVLDSKDFGVPQHRERIFVVGYPRTNTRPQVFPLSEQVGENYAKHIKAKAPTLRTLTAGGHSGGDHSGMTMIITKNEGVEDTLRRLTPLECERAMGFPDGWTEQGINGPIAMTQRYKMLGNAVVVPVVDAILEKMI